MRFVVFFALLLSPSFAQDNNANRALTPPTIPAVTTTQTSPDPGQITDGRRFMLFINGTIGPETIVRQAAASGLGQWRDNPKEWGQGDRAYLHRFWTHMAGNGAHSTLTYATSAILGEDNRYFQSGKQGWARVGYALSSPFLAYHRDRRRTFSFSNWVGVWGASVISRQWLPGSQQGLRHISQDAGYAYLGAVCMDLFREFVWHRRQQNVATRSAGHP